MFRNFNSCSIQAHDYLSSNSFLLYFTWVLICNRLEILTNTVGCSNGLFEEHYSKVGLHRIAESQPMHIFNFTKSVHSVFQNHCITLFCHQGMRIAIALLFISLTLGISSADHLFLKFCHLVGVKWHLIILISFFKLLMRLTVFSHGTFVIPFSQFTNSLYV